ncbi:single-stranded-DNA-specific exonuclease RecJ [Candidatus Dojkabacteria bacterium]|nr:single-stranded-DNA-specific exonuclease RecJ [Candidatus Dojkabacteria bacterium]
MSKNWKILPKITKKASKQLDSYPTIIQQLLYNRGILSKDEAQEFLDPDFVQFHDFSKIYNIKSAAKIILGLIEQKKKIFIHGDFDVDGICSTSILWDFLYRGLEADVLPYVPSRFDEGYGMSEESLTNIAKQGGEVVITVDCGIKDDELIARWKKKGLEFIVTDHHELKKKSTSRKGGKTFEKVVLPDMALTIVHPEHPKSSYPFTKISGAAVVWKLVCTITKKAAIDFEPDNYLDLVALSTVCDVMPLTDENRSILKVGLRQIQGLQKGQAQVDRVGLKRLIYDAGLDPSGIDAYHLGFIIGPRLNAAGRLDHAIDAIRLLTTKKFDQAREISEKLNSLNQKRQRIQEDIYKNALKQIEEYGFESKLYFVWGEDWAEGVIGIVAGKICETYHRPVLVATRKGKIFTGSARSIDQFNIVDAINSQSDLLDRFGGHPLAAGFTVKAENIEQFRDNLLEIADRELSDGDTEKEDIADYEIELNDINLELLGWLGKFSPFGFGNPKPRFILRKAKVTEARLVGAAKNHLLLAFLNEDTGEYLKGIGFGLGEDFKEIKPGDRIDLLFTLEIDDWNGGEKIQLNVKDIEKI